MLELIPTIAPRCVYAAGDLIFSLGDPALWLYEVVHGEVRLLGRRADGTPGEVAVLGRGSLVGLDALTGDPYRVHALAHAPSVELRPVDPRELDDAWLRRALVDRLRGAEQRALDAEVQMRFARWRR